jgi:hypothetical protein
MSLALNESETAYTVALCNGVGFNSRQKYWRWPKLAAIAEEKCLRRKSAGKHSACRKSAEKVR